MNRKTTGMYLTTVMGTGNSSFDRALWYHTTVIGHGEIAQLIEHSSEVFLLPDQTN